MENMKKLLQKLAEGNVKANQAAIKTGLTEVTAIQAEMKTSQNEMKTGLSIEIISVQDKLTQDMREGQKKMTQSMQYMKEELKGISATQYTLQEVVQERHSTMETRMDSFEENVTLVRQELTTVHDKVMLVEAKISQIEEDFGQKFEQTPRKIFC